MPDLLSRECAVLEDWRSLITKEFAYQRRSFAERRSQPVEARVERGTCWDGLRFVRLDASDYAVFAHGGNDSRMREGDLVRVSRGRGDEGVAGWIYREEADRVWLGSKEGWDEERLKGSPEGWMLDEDFLDLERVYLEVLDEVAKSQTGQERILPLLTGMAEAGLDGEEYDAARDALAGSGAHWEETQEEAIASCLAAEHCYLVQGPPGTGKTRVLAEVVGQLVGRGERVLITGATHRAIDHALGAAARVVGDRGRVGRFAAKVHRREESFDSFECFRDSPLVDVEGGWVAGATPFGLRRRLREVEFDAVVMDEAGQMTTALALMAMLAGRKYLLFGDDQQLGPVMVSESRQDARYRGIFHALRAQEAGGTMLDVTYRLNRELAQWPSESFYGGELRPAQSVEGRRLGWRAGEETEDWVEEVLRPEVPLVWISFPEGGSRTVNENEIAAAARLLQALAEGGVRPEEIAVVTPYRRQARGLRRRLETMMPGRAGLWRECVIDTVERMQGQEREVILVSLCASDPEFIAKQAEFLYDPRRLNVSVTRARSKLVILASEALLNAELESTELQEDLALFQSLSREATRNERFLS